VCPDSRIGAVNHATLVSGSQADGTVTVIYKIPVNANEAGDKTISLTSETNIIAAIGTLSDKNEANYHQVAATRSSIKINFGGENQDTCPVVETTVLKAAAPEEAWPPSVIRDVTEFTAVMGPTGGNKGYQAITGNPSWGIAWYINDKLIPEIYVKRGQTYTFSVEGGDKPSNAARYHPLYITDSEAGGYHQKTPEDQAREQVFAGVEFDSSGKPRPSAAGRLCEYSTSNADAVKNSKTFAEYFSTLTLQCDGGSPAKLSWTVALNTPDTVYYQCYTHNNLGWKIHVTN